MRETLLLTFFFILFTIPCFAQEIKSCPEIKVVVPDRRFAQTEPMPFSVSLSEEAYNFKLEYQQKILGGKIIEGQGTKSITVVASELNSSDIKSTVEIKGLPENCVNTFEGIGEVLLILDISSFDEYGKLPLREELARIDLFGMYLINDKDTKGVINMFFRNAYERNQAKNRITRIYKLLTEKYRIANERILIRAINDSSDSYTELWIYQKEKSVPQCPHCEIIKREAPNTKKTARKERLKNAAL